MSKAWRVLKERNERRCERIREAADPMDGSDLDWSAAAERELERVMRHLARGDDATTVVRMDNRFSRLPGLESLRIFGDVLVRATVPAALG